MTPADFIGAGVAFPMRADRRGGIALVEGADDVAEAIRVIIGTTPGERPMRPEFGCGAHEYVFDVVDTRTLGRLEQEIRVALDRWEPRITVLAIDFDVAASVDGQLEIEITYLLRATNDVRNLVYPFYVIPAEEQA